ncbi:unnamed protein product, partial [Iphiclides podalirius]
MPIQRVAGFVSSLAAIRLADVAGDAQEEANLPDVAFAAFNWGGQCVGGNRSVVADPTLGSDRTGRVDNCFDQECTEIEISDLLCETGVSTVFRIDPLPFTSLDRETFAAEPLQIRKMACLRDRSTGANSGGGGLFADVGRVSGPAVAGPGARPSGYFEHYSISLNGVGITERV